MQVTPPPDPKAATVISGRDNDYWQSLVNERDAGAFLGLTDRTMQALRQRGGGPKYILLSSRCIRYRRIDLRIWANARMRASTSDPGEVTA